MAVNPIQPIRSVELIDALVRTGKTGKGDFPGALADAINAVQKVQTNAAESVQRFLDGEGGDLHQIAVEQQKAGLAFDMFLSVRNKVVQAYQEVMRMQV
jgi:flagellar hook-basal body complex protein FliE